MKSTEALEIIGKHPELVPLSDEQKDAFTKLWANFPDYEKRKGIVGSISDLYGNRMRYRELLTKKEDIEMFDRILKDPTTKF